MLHIECEVLVVSCLIFWRSCIQILAQRTAILNFKFLWFFCLSRLMLGWHFKIGHDYFHIFYDCTFI